MMMMMIYGREEEGIKGCEQQVVVTNRWMWKYIYDNSPFVIFGGGGVVVLHFEREK